MVGGAALALGAYELAAGVVNDALDEKLLPSLVGALTRFRFRDAARRLFPTWVRTAMLFALGGIVGAVAELRRSARATAKQKAGST